MYKKPVKMIFVRFINGHCVVKEFPTRSSAIHYVFEYFISPTVKAEKLSKTMRLKIFKKLKDAAVNKRYYCNGQWIEVIEE